MPRKGSGTAVLSPEIQEFVDAVEIENLDSLYRIFRRIEVARVALQTRKSHLAKQVVCLECAERFGPERAIWVPNKAIKSCPHCTQCGRNIAIYLEFNKEDSDEGKPKSKKLPDICPHCGGKVCKEASFIPAPKEDLYVERFLPEFTILENRIKPVLEERVKEHPLWIAWAKDVKGMGPATLGRIMGMCDIKRLTSVTKMWTHSRLGLKDGQTQRSVKGKPDDFDRQLRSAFHLLGISLMMQQGAYYDFYLMQRERAEKLGLPKGHAHNRARFEMLKLVASHIWRKWREVEGLPTPMPYVIEYLGHRNYIPPENCTGENFKGFVSLPETPESIRARREADAKRAAAQAA